MNAASSAFPAVLDNQGLTPHLPQTFRGDWFRWVKVPRFPHLGTLLNLDSWQPLVATFTIQPLDARGDKRRGGALRPACLEP